MKTKILLFSFFLITGLFSYGQMFTWESFDGGQMPPAGWTIEGLNAQWAANNSNNAGGAAPEAQFTYVNQNTTTRVISPKYDMTGLDSVKISFRHMYVFYANPAPKVGIATRSHNGAWTIVWEKTPTGNIPAQKVDVTISSADVGQSEFQVCFYLTGNMYNMDYYYLDNILLFNPLNLDAGIVSLSASPTYFADPFFVKGTIMNTGLTTITGAEVKYKLDDGPVFTTAFSGLSVATQGTYNFTCNQLMTAPLGAHELTVWLNTVNGIADDGPNNDTLRKTVNKICYDVFRKPLYEEFTSSTCAPCASFNTGFVPWCLSHDDSITLVKYQMSWPAPGDPYFTAEGGVRRTFYGVNAVPSLFVNGGGTATTVSAANMAFNMAKLQVGMMKIAGAHTLANKVMTINATILPFYNFNNVKVYIVVMEKITHNNVGNNGETSFHHVMMKMVPDAQGTGTSLVDRVPFTINETVDLSGTHVEEFTDLIVAIFIQDPASKQVFQSGYSVENAQYSNENRLSNILVDGTPLAGFDPETFSYNVVLQGGATTVPEITGVPFEPEETVIVVPSNEILGTTTIDVFAENLTDHNLYSLNFQWAVGQNEVKSDNIRLYPNPTKGNIYLYGASHASVSIYNSIGNLVTSLEDFTGNSLNLSALPKGVYMLKVEKTDHTVLQKKIVIM